jgi:acyl-coenzyme A thioesterase PaaI-like protein
VSSIDPFVEFSASRVLEADGRHAIAEQDSAPELDNHAGVRHAGALFAVGYAASRALVAAALAPVADSMSVELTESGIEYHKVVAGQKVRATAEPRDETWDTLLAQALDGKGVQLPTSVTLRGEDGEVMTEMSATWQVTPQSQL